MNRFFLFRPVVFFLLFSLYPFLVCTAPSAGASQTFSSASQLVSAVTGRAAPAISLECAVYQEKHLAMLAKPVVFTGRMSMRRPDMLRWEFKHPIPSVFIINGSRVFRCTPSSPLPQPLSPLRGECQVCRRVQVKEPEDFG